MLLNQPAIRNTFKAYERLKREQHIDTLFQTGKAYSVFPIKVIHKLVPRTEAETAPVRAGFSVPKKKFRKSVQRHRIRRLMVEAWRLQKNAVYMAIPGHMQLHIFIIYTDRAMPDQQIVMDAVAKSVEQLVKLYKTDADA